MFDRAELMDPMALKELLWPDVYFYGRQREVIYSVVEDSETYVVAGNKLGKDFVAAFIVLYFFLTRRPVRIVTTSAKDHHLDVLWGEIDRAISRSKYKLRSTEGGPLIVNHQHIRKITKGEICPISYITGMVASHDTVAAMQGHHANPDTVEEANDGVPRTLFVSDESSSVPDEYYTMVGSWAKRMLIFGNAWECENFFKRGVKGGNVPAPDGRNYDRKVIQIRADESPNVRLGLARARLGEPHTNQILVPGVKEFREYEKDRRLLDPIQQSVKLDAEFYEGKEVKMFPSEWLTRAKRIARDMRDRLVRRQAKAIGIDPAQGGDKTAMCAVDEMGVIEIVSRRTPNTADITAEALAFMRYHGVSPERVFFDAGGGGRQHADRLVADGYPVRSVGFGESVTPELRTGIRLIPEQNQHRQERYSYVNRRAEMYGTLRLLLDPSLRYLDEALGPTAIPRDWEGFGISDETPEGKELLRQLAPIPLTYDREGRLKLLPKDKPRPDSKEPTLTDLIGCSPDEADSLALAVHAMVTQPTILKAEVW